MMKIVAAGAVLAVSAASALAVKPPPKSDMQSATAVGAADLRHADPDLEALLPTSLGGAALVVESQVGPELSTTSGPFDAFLTSLGKNRSDFSLASAYSRGSLEAQAGAWRVKGAEPKLLMPGFRAAVQASSTVPLTQVEEIMAGRTVTRIGDPGQLTRGPLYVVVRGDTLVFVQTTDPAIAAEAVEKFPD